MQLSDIISKLTTLPMEEQKAVEAMALQDTQGVAWVPNPGPQTDAYFCKADELFYGGQAGGGKMSCNQSLTLTPTGWKKLGLIKVGDKLCATDGTVQEVIGVFPQGLKDAYLVSMRGGGSTIVGLEHNWLAWRTHTGGKKNNLPTCGAESARKWTTGQMLDEMNKGARDDGIRRGFAIPVTEPVKFNVAGQLKGRGIFIGREIDPYILGLLLGDGHLSKINITLTSMDAEIAEAFELFGKGEVSCSQKQDNAASSYSLRGDILIKTKAALTDLNLLGTKSHDKFIPRQYLFAPVEERWALLQGLMDTDGWVEDKRALYYVSISEQLTCDVEHLARSLGAVTSRTSKIPNYSHKGELKQGQRAYCVRIKLPHPEQAFRLTRKKVIASGINHQSEGRIIESIESCGQREMTCIAVSNPNSLYITDDFIVTHNTDLMLGLAMTEHRASLILRRTNKEVNGLVERMTDITGSRDGWSSQTGAWRLPDGRIIELGGCQLEEDRQKYKGHAKDFYGFDEVSDFSKSQYEFIIGWNRSTIPNQRCRIVAAGNPPTRPEGIWVLTRWAAWLDPQHTNPAEPGELRWYTTGPDGDEIEVDGAGPHLINGEYVYARSRTYIPATLSDNPDLIGTGYQASLDALPAELRAAYRDGNFGTSLRDDPYQIIPTDWVTQAQARWTPQRPVGIPMCAIGADVAIAKDKFVLAARFDGWFDKLIVIPGKEVADAKKAAGRILAMRTDNARVVVDVGGGWGADCYAQLTANGIDAIGYMGVKTTKRKSADNRFTFSNVRTEALWKFREALDPSQPGGSQIILPPSATLKADLCAPSYQVKGNHVGALLMAESKEKVCERLGRSTDEGDAVIMSWYDGIKQHNMNGGWTGGRSNPVVNRGKRYQH